ncbi:MAG: hypothetical protein M3285_04590, partial [Actinomycetota bacterium]|nr:hypothetical protein [Actinomycetota bacterium]
MSATETATTPAPTESAGPPTPWSPSSRGWWARGIVLFVIFGGILLITTSVPGYWAAHISL